MKKIFTAICREPYRLYFPLGILSGTTGIIQWTLYAAGLIPSYSGFIHSSIQTMVYMNCFIIGFLMTALPRFTQTRTATWWEVITPTSLFTGIIGFLMANQWVESEALLLGFYAFLIIFVLRRVLGRPKDPARPKPPVELMWVPIGLLQGITGALILILGQTKALPVWALRVGKPMLDQAFLTSLVIGVGGFLIPRLMGTFDQTVLNDQSRKQRSNYYLICASLFFISFFIEGFGWFAWGYGLRAAAVTAALLKTNLLTSLPRNKSIYVWGAWLSVRLVVSGFWFASLFNAYQTLMLHITFLGGFSLMVFMIASMVIMSHAGEGERLNEGVWIIPFVLVGVLVSLMIRLLVAFLPDLYFQLLGGSSVIWIICAWVWFIYMMPRLLTVPDEDEFARLHERVKAQRNLN